jgi:hypothetical protein
VPGDDRDLSGVLRQHLFNQSLYIIGIDVVYRQVKIGGQRLDRLMGTCVLGCIDRRYASFTCDVNQDLGAALALCTERRVPRVVQPLCMAH